MPTPEGVLTYVDAEGLDPPRRCARATCITISAGLLGRGLPRQGDNFVTVSQTCFCQQPRARPLIRTTQDREKILILWCDERTNSFYEVGKISCPNWTARRPSSIAFPYTRGPPGTSVADRIRNMMRCGGGPEDNFWYTPLALMRFSESFAFPGATHILTKAWQLSCA